MQFEIDRTLAKTIHFGWLSLWLSLFLAGCTIFSPPVSEATATVSIDRPPTVPAQATATLPSPQPSATNTMAAPSPADRTTPLQPTLTRAAPSPTPTRTPVYAYMLQPGSPSYVPNIFRQELGCAWMGVGGQVFDRNGDPVQGVIVEVQGELEGQEVLELSISGGAPQYGAGGYEITLADRPIASEDRLQAALYDLQGKPLSEKIGFDTLDACTANLILINFLANDYFQTRYYLPFAGSQSTPRSANDPRH